MIETILETFEKNPIENSIILNAVQDRSVVHEWAKSKSFVSKSEYMEQRYALVTCMDEKCGKLFNTGQLLPPLIIPKGKNTWLELKKPDNICICPFCGRNTPLFQNDKIKFAWQPTGRMLVMKLLEQHRYMNHPHCAWRTSKKKVSL